MHSHNNNQPFNDFYIALLYKEGAVILQMRPALPKGIDDLRTGLCPDAPNAPGILFSLIIPQFLNWDFLLFHVESIELLHSLHKPAAS